MAAGSATAKIGGKMMIVHPFAGAATLGAGATLIILSKNKEKKWLKRNAKKFEVDEDGTVSVEGEVVGVAQEKVEGVEVTEEDDVVDVADLEDDEDTTDADTNTSAESSDEEMGPHVEALENDIEKELQADIDEKLKFHEEDGDGDVATIIARELKKAEKEMANRSADTEDPLEAEYSIEGSDRARGSATPSRAGTDESMATTERTSSSRTDSLETVDRTDSAKDRAMRAREEMFTTGKKWMAKAEEDERVIKGKKWMAKAEEDERFVKGKKWMAKGQERMTERLSSFDSSKAKKNSEASA